MSVPTAIHPTLINGRAASAAELAPLAFSGFAHFTAMQVRDRKVKGIDLHLARLRGASMTLFGAALPDETVLRQLRQAIAAGPADMSLTATAYWPDGEFTARTPGTEPAMLVRTGPPSGGPAGPLRLDVAGHERHMAAIKHVGEGAKTYYLHRALERGFDDAAFLDRHGRLGEATIWNLAFWDGHAVVWPRADILIGTTMGIVQRQLQRLDVPQRHQEIRPADLAGFAGAAVMNSWTPGIAVSALGPHAFAEAAPFMALLGRAYGAEPALAV